MNYHEMRTIPVHAYTHNLNANIIRAFILFVEEYLEKKFPVNIASQKEFPKINYCQRNNFQKLQYFGIVKRLSNGYILTREGEAFYYGEKRIPKKVATLENVILPFSHEAWKGEKLPVFKYIWEILKESEFTWKKRPEYQKEASMQTRFDNWND